MKYLSFLFCLFLSLVSMNITAQSSNSNCKSTTKCSSKSYNMSVSISETDNNSNYSIEYSNQYTDEVEAFLIKKLGKRYSKTGKSSKKWNNEYTVVSKNGHARITYNGSNESTRDEAKELFNDIIAAVKSEKE